MVLLWRHADQVKCNMKILALDYGVRRIGLAIGDDTLRFPLPFGVIQVVSMDAAITQIAHIVTVEKISKIIIGLPLGLDGREGDNAIRVRSFGDQLSVIGCEIEYIDERFTSREADRMGGSATRDEKAAMLILESFFNKK